MKTILTAVLLLTAMGAQANLNQTVAPANGTTPR
jgi:hypothetical protein